MKIKSQVIYEKIQEKLKEVPKQYYETCQEIMAHARLSLGEKLDESIMLPLLDCMYYANAKEGKKRVYRNALSWEVKRFYPEEYQVALHASAIMEKKLKLSLSEEEITSLALHIIDAKSDNTMEETLKVVEFINKILNIIRFEYGINFDENSFHFLRFITHLKYFAYRVFHSNLLQEQDRELVALIKNNYYREYLCCKKIAHMLLQTYGLRIEENELVYLAMHIKRVTMLDTE